VQAFCEPVGGRCAYPHGCGVVIQKSKGRYRTEFGNRYWTKFYIHRIHTVFYHVFAKGWAPTTNRRIYSQCGIRIAGPLSVAQSAQVGKAKNNVSSGSRKKMPRIAAFL